MNHIVLHEHLIKVKQKLESIYPASYDILSYQISHLVGVVVKQDVTFVSGCQVGKINHVCASGCHM